MYLGHEFFVILILLIYSLDETKWEKDWMGSFFIDQPLYYETDKTECLLLFNNFSYTKKLISSWKTHVAEKQPWPLGQKKEVVFVSKINPFHDQGLADVKKFTMLEPSSRRPWTKKKQTSLEKKRKPGTYSEAKFILSIRYFCHFFHTSGNFGIFLVPNI